MKSKVSILLLSLLLNSLTPTLKAETIVLGSLDWEPYIGQNLKDMGYVAQVVNAALANSGHKLEIKYYPWVRTVRLANAGELNGYFPEYYSKEVELNCIFSEPFPGGPVGLFKRTGSKIKYNKLEDLKPYKIGVVRGYVNEAKFDAATFLNKQQVPDDITNIKKLLRNRIDLFVADKFVAFYLLNKELPYMKGQIEFIEPALENQELYVCFSRKVRNSEKISQDFNAGLKKLKESGRIEEIMARHGF